MTMSETLFFAATAHPWVAALFASVVLLLAWSFHPLARYRLRHIPGPPPKPFVGNALELKRAGQVDFYSACAKKYGPVFKIWLGNRPVVVVADAAAGKKINLRNPTRHPLLQPMTYSKFGRVAGKGLFVAGATDPEAHRELKSIWLKVFNSASLAGFVDEMALGADILCSKIQRAADDAVAIDVWRALGAMTMDVVAKCAFGLDLKTQQNEGAEADERAATTAAAKEKRTGTGSPLGSPKAAAAAVAAASEAAAPESEAEERAEAERDLLARSMLSSARTIFATGSTSSVYGLLAMALPEFTRPVLRLFGTLFPGKVLRDLEGARATMLETSLALTRAARARVEGEARARVEGGSGRTGGGAAPPPGAISSRGVAKGAFPELFITASRAAPSGDGSASAASAGKSYDDITIAAQCQTFLLAGYETTATTLAFCVHWLASHPEAASKLTKELDDAAAEEREAREGDGDASAASDDKGIDVVDAATAATSIAGIGASAVARLPYLDAVLKEVMRLTPAAPITLRVASQDQVVSVPSSSAATKKNDDGVEKPSSLLIPKGTWIHIDSFHISRDPSVWGPDALSFRPERWLFSPPSTPAEGEGGARGGPASRSPATTTLQTWAFGDGNLACVGRRLAEWESKLTLAALFRRFEFSLEKKRTRESPENADAIADVSDVAAADSGQPEIECRLTLGPKAGVRVIATSRGARKGAGGEASVSLEEVSSPSGARVSSSEKRDNGMLSSDSAAVPVAA